MEQLNLSAYVKKCIGSVSSMEIIRAIPAASRKLQRIIEREGDADGTRKKPEYFAILIADEIRSHRMFLRCTSKNKKSVLPKQTRLWKASIL